MSEIKFPVCPICKKEVLLPFSITTVGGTLSEKIYGTWFCSNCGFFLTTRDTRANNPERDIEAGFNHGLRAEIQRMRNEYQKDSE